MVCADCAWQIIKGFGVLASSLGYLFTGISFGCFPILTAWEHTPKKFSLSFVQGYCLFASGYFLVAFFISAYHGYLDGFIIVWCLIALLLLSIILTMIAFNLDAWAFPLALSGMVLSIKLSHTVYFTADALIRDSESGQYSFLVCSLAFELLILLFYSLWPFFSFTTKNDDGKSYSFTLWAIEYSDVVSHVIVIMTYAAENDVTSWNTIVNVYFAFFIINLFLWVLPLYWLCLAVDNSAMEYLSYHLISLDIITDIPVLITTFAGRTYVGNAYICIDLGVKAVILVRSLGWAPFLMCNDKLKNLKRLHGMDFTKKEIQDDQKEIDRSKYNEQDSFS